MALAPNKMAKKRVTQLIGICNRCCENHTLATPLRVVGNDLQITLSGVCWRFNVILNAPMWSRGFLVPSYTSSWGRWNLGGKGHFKKLEWRVSLTLWHSWLHLTPFSCSSSSDCCHESIVCCAWKFLFCYFLGYGLHCHCHCGYAMTMTYLCPLDALSASSLHFVSLILAH